MTHCKFGLTLTNRGVITGASTLEDMVAITRRADQDKVWDSVWVGDSIFAKPRLDSIALLGGLALQTTRLRMGPACFASTPLRPALQLAYQWFSLDLLSAGAHHLCGLSGGGGGRWGTVSSRVQSVWHRTRLTYASYGGSHRDHACDVP